MVIMGIDLGDARTGVSFSDPTASLAGAPSVIHEHNPDRLLEALRELAKTRRAEKVVIGNPRNMDATQGARSEKSIVFAERLRETLGLEVVLWDERRTTIDAHRILSETGKRGKKRKAVVDAVSATLILQGYLDFLKNQP